MRRSGAGDAGALVRLSVAVAAASFSGPILRWAGAPPLSIASGRMFLALLIALGPAVAFVRRRGPRGLGIDRTVAAPMLLGTVALAAHFGTWTAGLYLTSVASSVVLVSAHPILVLAAEALLWKQAVSRRQWLGSALALVGIVLLAGLDGLTRGGTALWGDALSLAGAATYAVYVMASARVRSQVSASVYVVVLYGGCLLLLGAAALAVHQSWPSPAVQPRLWLAFLLMAIVPTTLGHSLVQSILDRVRPGVISIALLGEPVGAALLAWIFLGQPPALFDVLGGAITLAGIGIALWPGGEPAAAAVVP